MRRVLLAATSVLAFASGAHAADLGGQRVAVPSAILAPVFNWTGFYLGGHIGYGTGTTGWQYLPIGSSSAVHSDPKGVFGGIQVGYNWQVGANGVLGIETDLSASGLRGNGACVNPAWTCSSRMNWLGSTRIRAGLAADKALFYVTGGLAYGGVTAGDSNPALPLIRVTTTNTRVGFAVGAGIEYAFAANWTAKVEYMYYNLGSANYVVEPGLSARLTPQIHTVKLGVNYLFSTGPSAVVARY